MTEIKLENLTKKYDDKTVIDNLSASLELCGVTVFMGESGCGKTTLLRLIAGLEKPDCGTVSGVPEKISFMFQEDRLPDWLSAFENIKLVCDEKTAEKYLNAVFLSDERDTKASQLSGGMKRRVALARALGYNSSLVILDEPFKGLDEELKNNMIALVKNESVKRPFIVVAHEPQEAELLGGNIIRFSGIPLKIE